MRAFVTTILITLLAAPCSAATVKVKAQPCNRICAPGSVLNPASNLCEGGRHAKPPTTLGNCPASTVKTAKGQQQTLYYSDVFVAKGQRHKGGGHKHKPY
jgi:hypothetical protein